MDLKRFKELVLQNTFKLKNGMKVVNTTNHRYDFDDGTVIPQGIREIVRPFSIEIEETPFADFIDVHPDVDFVIPVNGMGVGYFELAGDTGVLDDLWNWIEIENLFFLASMITASTFREPRVISTIQIEGRGGQSKLAKANKFSVFV